MAQVPLSVLDLVPISSGSTAKQALANTLDLAAHAERLGYRRYWLAEHHLNPGVAGTSPPVAIALVAAATRSIRVGAGGMQMGHRTPLSVVEEFGLLDAAFPGRVDLGLGRSGGRRPRTDAASNLSSDERAQRPPGRSPRDGGEPASKRRIVDGLLLPERFSYDQLLQSPRFQLHTELLQQPGAETPSYDCQVADVLALLGGHYRASNGTRAHVVPGEHAGVEVWILGSSAGISAEVAARHGLPFAANYHVSPATVLEAIEAYRTAFEPSAFLAEPYVLVSADVVVADDDATARRHAAGYGAWVRSIRRGDGAIEFPTPEEAVRIAWSNDDRALVADRVDTQFVGSPRSVAFQLETLQRVTGADELIVTTITHDHADRVRSYQLLAQVWSPRIGGAAARTAGAATSGL